MDANRFDVGTAQALVGKKETLEIQKLAVLHADSGLLDPPLDRGECSPWDAVLLRNRVIVYVDQYKKRMAFNAARVLL